VQADSDPRFRELDGEFMAAQRHKIEPISQYALTNGPSGSERRSCSSMRIRCTFARRAREAIVCWIV
jgi:hypothetical protein